MTLRPRSWWVDDPDRLTSEQEDVLSVAPEMTWVDRGAGWFSGSIPVWPFDRESPHGLEKLVPVAAEVRVAYREAFPAVPPTIICVEPRPPVQLRSFEAFHILPNGGLCLLRDASQWNLLSRTSELILKASGWVIEYALLQAGVIERMTVSGIVEDGRYDDLITETAEKLT